MQRGKNLYSHHEYLYRSVIRTAFRVNSESENVFTYSMVLFI